MKYANVKNIFLAFVFAVYFFLLLSEASSMALINQNSDSEIRKSINFSGYEWDIKTGHYAPGKNNWSRENCWVDEKGFLHLKVTKIKDRWYCAEVSTKQLFSYGLYRFEVIGSVDHLDPNIVLGLFVYSAISEIDIEFAKWGKVTSPSGNFTVMNTTRNFPITLAGSHSLQQFEWDSKQVSFSSYHGHNPDDQLLISRQKFSLNSFGKNIPKPPVKVHINSWLFKGQAPVDKQEAEIVIKSFTYIPYSNIL